MEQLLLKLARQLDSLDEASLMALWNTYATRVSQFEPTQRWEEAALVFSLLQAKRWKNQLFNYNWAMQTRPEQHNTADTGFRLEAQAPQNTPKKPHKCAILQFKPLKKD